jgi:hypothetical protein
VARVAVALVAVSALGGLPRDPETAGIGGPRDNAARGGAVSSQQVSPGFEPRVASRQTRDGFPASGSEHALFLKGSGVLNTFLAEKRLAHELASSGLKEPLATGPAINFTGIFGGSGTNADGVAVDSAGNVYVTGGTLSGDFPTTPGAFQTAFRGVADAFVMKFDSTGSIVYSTYLGGTDFEWGLGITVDSSGSAYVVGGDVFGGLPNYSGCVPSHTGELRQHRGLQF